MNPMAEIFMIRQEKKNETTLSSFFLRLNIDAQYPELYLKDFVLVVISTNVVHKSGIS